MVFKKALKVTMVLIMMSLIAPTFAYAYIDPGTGSYIFQIIAAALFGGLFALKQFWGKIIGFFKKEQ